MPELPEVETIVRGLRPVLVGRMILSAGLLWSRSLVGLSPGIFKKRIRGQRIESLSRRAKFINLRLSEDNLLIHLRMSGDLQIREGGYEPQKHDRLILSLSPPSTLVFNDPRKFGRVWLTSQPDKVLGNLGPEPLDPSFTPRVFYERLQAHSRQLKPLLLDQTFLAGMGNIYTDEALHLARLNPMAQADLVTSKKAKDLWHAVQSVLEDGIRNHGASIDWVYRGGEFQNHFRVYGRAGEPCTVCGTKIERVVICQRSTYFCPRCQPFEGGEQGTAR